MTNNEGISVIYHKVSQKIELPFCEDDKGKQTSNMTTNTNTLPISFPIIYSNGDTKVVRWVDRPKHIDGHFWVEDEEGDVICDRTGETHRKKMASRGDIAVYLPANQADEERFIREQYEAVTRKNIDDNYGGDEEYYYDELSKKDLHSFDCYQNAMLVAYLSKGKGRVRFGFFGALKPDGMIYWYFGHPANTYDDFLADPQFNQRPEDIKNNYETHIKQHPELVARMDGILERKELAKKEAKDRAEKIHRAELIEKEKKAKKAEAELFEMLDKEEAQSKKKNKKNKSKK